LCGGVSTKCKKTTKCQEEGGTCYEEDQVPFGFLHIGGCKGECKCYKDGGSESLTLSLSARSNLPNMTVPDTNTTIPDEEKGNRGIQLRGGYSCNNNGWDSPQYCKCQPGERISKFRSRHNSRKEDRIWELKCEDIIPKAISATVNWQQGTSGENWWDDTFHWVGIFSNSYMVGMSSYHDNGREDRRYKVFWARSDNWVLTNCGNHIYGDWHKLNTYDRDVNLHLGPKQVIVELLSYHNNRKEDREFYVKICDLTPKCGELVSITYGQIQQSTNDDEIISENQSDNRKGRSNKSYTISISQSQQNTYADKYEYSRSKGWSTTNSLSISASATLNFPRVGGVTLTATTGFEATFKDSKTWTRSQTKSYGETHGSKTSWTSNCGPGCYCKTFIKAAYGKARIPYTMITKSSGKKNPFGGSETCKEEGWLHVSRSWNTKDVHDDKC